MNVLHLIDHLGPSRVQTIIKDILGNDKKLKGGSFSWYAEKEE